MIKTREELIKKFIEFFESKDHKRISSSSLIPENDPTVLFTTAGMHPLVPFLLGQPHTLGKRIANVQKCIRTQDIEEVGDEVHHTFFEMLGNWSFGDYFKNEAIKWSLEFLTSKEWLGIPKEKIAVSVFAGDEDAPRDSESAEIWSSLGISEERIAFLPKENNWWGPAGTAGPCGPDTEMFFWTGAAKAPEKFNPDDKNWVEIWNDVFMQYEKTKDGKYCQLKQKNVDTGMGVERTLAVLNGLSDNYQTSSFKSIIEKIQEISQRNYKANKKEMRIIADHLRAAVFILGDERGVKPGNIGQSYVLRRLIRRAIRYGKILGIEKEFCSEVCKVIIELYKDYEEILRQKELILKEVSLEEERFNKTLGRGLRKFEEFAAQSKGKISGKDAFLLFQSYGFPIEMTTELAAEKRMEVDLAEFETALKFHQELSRKLSAGVFKSGLSDDSEKTTRLHTATHLLNEALRKVLGKEVRQKGSNITPERLRFDFNFPRKLAPEEITRVENLVNEKISEALDVIREEVALKDAIASGAQSEFGTKYPDIVSVYTVLDESEDKGWFSREICTGPHVRNTKEIGVFKIVKEESVSAGVRRIKAQVLGL